MRSSLSILFIIALVFGGGFWYRLLADVCPIPMGYRIGDVDPRFHLSNEQVQVYVSQAEALWETKTSKELFVYDEAGPLTIQFVYDERQEKADEEEHLRQVLEDTEGLSDNVRTQYETLFGEYKKLKNLYEARVDAYETLLATYNAEVSEWNTRGGAPEDVYKRLSTEEATLNSEAGTLSQLAQEVNELVRSMNTLAARGNSIVADYNAVVETYNKRVGGTEAFTQGEYRDRQITIFEYGEEEELVLVLAHELGHALSLDHVDDEQALMYYLMDKQSTERGATDADVAEFTARCGDGTLTGRFVQALKTVFESISNPQE